MDNNENKEICAHCGGACCKGGPGIYHPDDFAPATMRETILAGLRAGLFQIDWWEAEQRGYYLRPAIKNDTRTFSPAWGGECANLGPEGCALPFQARPRGCRELVPHKSMRCGGPESYDKEQAKDAWANCKIFKDIIKELE